MLMYHYLFHSSMFVRRNLTPMGAFDSILNFLANNDWLRNVNIIYFKPINQRRYLMGPSRECSLFLFLWTLVCNILGETWLEAVTYKRSYTLENPREGNEESWFPLLEAQPLSILMIWDHTALSVWDFVLEDRWGVFYYFKLNNILASHWNTLNLCYFK